MGLWSYFLTVMVIVLVVLPIVRRRLYLPGVLNATAEIDGTDETLRTLEESVTSL